MGLLATVAALGAIVGPYIPGITIVTAPAIPLWGPIAAVAGIMATFTGGLGLWINDKMEGSLLSTYMQRQAAVERKEFEEFQRNVIAGGFFIFLVIAVITVIFYIRKRRTKNQAQDGRETGWFRLRIPFIRR
ncbi:hypothetical protein HOLleu_24888 [Holothuria leucospilota]|uniref:Uncharacterized protein n=1 Tax=Holothuria leucospilota TaxID=206669 RepID=A0A9Q1H3Z4_HOLLE|nr:hypothetical protein HOLleu_24888 [Holothuria leucospilota]